MKNNKEMYLICEEAVDTQFTLKEEKPTGEIVIEVKLQDFFKRNRNGRIYGEALKNALRTSELQELMGAKSWFGEAGHPADKDLSRQVTIDPTLISHEMRSIWVDGDTLFAHVHTIPGVYGEQFKAMIQRGTRVAFSLRAVGNVKKLQDGTMEVVAPMRVITYDWVILPSHQCAYQQRIVSESAVSNIDADYRNEVTQESAIFEKLNLAKVLTESKNVKEISKQLEFIYESIELSTDRTHAILKEKDGSATLYIKLEEYVTNRINSQMASLIGEAKTYAIDENALATNIGKTKYPEDRKATILNYIEMNKGKSDYAYNEVGSTAELVARNRLFSTQDIDKYAKANAKYLQKETEWRVKLLEETSKSAAKFLRDKKCYWIADNGFGDAYYYSTSNKHLYYYSHEAMSGKDITDDGTLESYLSNNIDELYTEIVNVSGMSESTRNITIAKGVGVAESMSILFREQLDPKLLKEYINKNSIKNMVSNVNEKSSAYDYFIKNIYHETHLFEFIAANETYMRNLTAKFYASVKEAHKYDPCAYSELTARNKEILIVGEMCNSLGSITPVAVNASGKLLQYHLTKNKDGVYSDRFTETTYDEWLKSDSKYIVSHIKNRGV